MGFSDIHYSFEDIKYIQLTTDMNQQLLDKFESIIGEAQNVRVTVALDWLSVLFTDEKRLIPEPTSDKDVFEINDRLFLVYTGKGNEHYKHIFNVQLDKEHVATILAHTRNPKFVKEGTIKVDFKNHLLYSKELWNTYHLIETEFELVYRNISRVDIAIDGMNYLIEFLNMYHKQKAGAVAVRMVDRPSFNTNILCRKTMQFQNIIIGSKKGIKKITVYNKSLDIVKTGKTYIQSFWQKNKMIEHLMDIRKEQEKLKQNKEVFYLEDQPNIYRFEIRLKGESIKTIAGFNIHMLKTVEGLIGIVKLKCDNFFDFRINDDERISRCTPLTLIPFHQFTIENLEHIPREAREDLYKAKLTCNMVVRALYLDVDGYEIEDATNVQTIEKCLNRFNLHKWFKDKLQGEWRKKYGKQNSNEDHVAMVTEMLMDILNKGNPQAHNFKHATEQVIATTAKDLDEHDKINNPLRWNFLPDDYELGDTPEDAPF